MLGMLAFLMEVFMLFLAKSCQIHVYFNVTEIDTTY